MLRADSMGLPTDEVEKFLADLKSEAGEKVIADVAHPLLRIFEGKDLKGNDSERLLSAVKTLHEYGQPHATEQIEWRTKATCGHRACYSQEGADYDF